MRATLGGSMLLQDAAVGCCGLRRLEFKGPGVMLGNVVRIGARAGGGSRGRGGTGEA